MLDISIEDASTHQHAAHLGAALQAGHKMYSHLQALYVPKTVSVSDQVTSTVHTDPCTSSKGEDDYQSIEIEGHQEAPAYLNVYRKKPVEKDREDVQRYRNVGIQDQAEVREAVYDKVEYNSEPKEIVTRNEDYYNVVAADRIEDEMYSDRAHNKRNSLDLPTKKTNRKEAPPLAPKPAPRKPKRMSGGIHVGTNELLEIDYFEVGGSVFTINNDQVVV